MYDFSRVIVTLAVVSLVSGCGSSPSPVAPTTATNSTPPAGLRLGPNLLALAGSAAVADGNGPIRTTCVPGLGPTGGMQHWNYGELRAEADGWLFQGGQPAGSMTLRLRTGAPQGRSASATGMLHASSLDAGWMPLFVPSGVRLDTDAATLQGEVSRGPGLTGRLTGTIVFVGADGTRSTCSEVSIAMMPSLP